MKRESLIVALALTVLPAFTASAATTFFFEDVPSGFNFGTFISPIDLSPGIYNLSSLEPFSVEFPLPGFPPEVLSNIDIRTPIDQTEVKITQFAPGVESLNFEGVTLFLYNYDEYPRGLYIGGNVDNFYEFLGYEGPSSGTYLALSPAVPEPSTWTMMLLGFAGLGFAGYRQAKRASFQEARQGAACNVPSHDPQCPPSLLKHPDRKVDVGLR